jgi:hypothetical protein
MFSFGLRQVYYFSRICALVSFRIIEAEKLKLADAESAGTANLGAKLLDFFKFFGDEWPGGNVLFFLWEKYVCLLVVSRGAKTRPVL